MVPLKRRRKTLPGVSQKESTPPRSYEGFVTPATPQSSIEVIDIGDIQTPVTWKKKRRPTLATYQESCLPRLCDIMQDEPLALAVGRKRKSSARMGTRTLDGDSKKITPVEQRRRSARLLDRDRNKDCRASDSDDNNPQEGSSGSSQGRKRSHRANNVEENAFSPKPNTPAPKNEKKRKKKKKKKKKKRLARKTVDLESDSEKENVQREAEENGHLGGFGELDGNRSRKSHINRSIPLLGRSSCQGWTKAQDIALHNAYFTVKPIPNFWKEIAKLVPGKSSNECFHRFYSAHPTPPVSRPRSRLNGNKSEPPVRSLDDMHTLLKSAGSGRRKSGSAKQNLLHVRKTVRHILRKQMSDDQGYEADLFSVVETLDSSLQSHMLPTISAPETPDSGIKCGGVSMPGQTLSAHRTKSLSRFSAESHRQLQQQLVSPEVLKQVKNPALHDKYIDQLHSREAARKKTWTQNAKVQSNRVEANMETLPQTDTVYAAKAAVIAEAQEVLRQSQCNENRNYIGIGYCVRNNDEGESDENAEEQEEEIEGEDLL